MADQVGACLDGDNSRGNSRPGPGGQEKAYGADGKISGAAEFPGQLDRPVRP